MLATAKLPHWAVTGVVVVGLVGLGMFTVAVVSARRPTAACRTASRPPGGCSRWRSGASRCFGRRLRGRGLFFQTLGWTLQLLAVCTVMLAFFDVPLPAAALVLLLMNVATVFPLWPGNVGLLQAAIALPLVQYGVAYGTGFAYGLALQAVEMSVGVGVGLVFLAREGLSFAALKRIEDEEESSAEDVLEELPVEELDDLAARRRRAHGGTPGRSRHSARRAARCDHGVGGCRARGVAGHRRDEGPPRQRDELDVVDRRRGCGAGYVTEKRDLAEPAPGPKRRPRISTSPH